MSNTDKNEICENCKHFSQEDDDCRKNAPIGCEGHAWPSVKKTNWCSEFESNKEKASSSFDV